jgi:hypothetical protein
MNFSRNLYATMLIAVFGAIVLASAQTRDAMDGAAAAAAQTGAQGFASVFFIAAASFAIALMAIVRLEEKPLRAGGEEDVE